MQLSEEVQDNLSKALFNADEDVYMIKTKIRSIQEALMRPEVNPGDLMPKFGSVIIYAEDLLCELEGVQDYLAEICDEAGE